MLTSGLYAHLGLGPATKPHWDVIDQRDLKSEVTVIEGYISYTEIVRECPMLTVIAREQYTCLMLHFIKIMEGLCKV